MRDKGTKYPMAQLCEHFAETDNLEANIKDNLEVKGKKAFHVG